ncbi:MAG: ubiquinol-cytochrome C chaperone family protein [Devosia sp.]
MIFKLFRKPAPDDAVYATYNSIVAQSRQPHFYASWGVPDTVTGRFDMISLHLALLLRRLRADPAGSAFGQQLVDLFFRDMDRSLRQMGAGDLSVPKKMRDMGKLFYGTATALDAALADPDPKALESVLIKNIYGGVAHVGAGPLANHVKAEASTYELRPISALIGGAEGVAA